MPLIDADSLWKTFENAGWWDNADRDVAQDLLDKAPAVDAEPVRHGRWKVFYENLQEQLSGCQCSVCEYTFFGRISDSYNFCPRCEAKMDDDITY